MTAALILLACLAHHPDRCERFEVIVERCELPQQQFAAASLWAAEHAGWTLRRLVGCEAGRPA